MKRNILYFEFDNNIPFEEWVCSLSEFYQARIYKRLLKIETDGYLGDYKSVGDGVFELRFFFGSGYRVYFGFDGTDIILLLCGGDK